MGIVSSPDHPSALAPLAHERGVATGDPAELSRRLSSAWEHFIAVAAEADFDAPSRRKPWTGRHVVAHVGHWEAGWRIDHLVADARAGSARTIDQAVFDQAVLDTHSGASAEEIHESLVRARDEAVGWISSPEAAEFGLTLTSSPLGPLPVLSVLHATIYQLAVASLDLEPCGVRAPDELLDLGLFSLVDVTGGLAARRNIQGTFQAETPGGVMSTGSRDGAWRTLLTQARVPGPAITATSRDVVDVTSGRGDPVGLYRSGRIAIHDMSGLIKLAPALDGVPGVPPLAAMSKAFGLVESLGGLFGRFGRR